MEPIFAVLIALFAPLPALKRVPDSLLPPLWYGAGTVFIAWGLQVLVPVALILGGGLLYFVFATRSFSSPIKNPHP